MRKALLLDGDTQLVHTGKVVLTQAVVGTVGQRRPPAQALP